jgi:hypothetical protein
MNDATLRRKLQHLTRAFPGTKLIAVTQQGNGPNDEKEPLQMSLWDNPEETVPTPKLFTASDAKDHLVLLKPIKTDTIAVTVPSKEDARVKETRDSDVTYCDLIMVQLNPPVLHKDVPIFWTRVREQLEPKVGSGRWIAGRLRQGNPKDKTVNQKEWWMEQSRKTDADQLTSAIENHVIAEDLRKQSSDEPF